MTKFETPIQKELHGKMSRLKDTAIDWFIEKRKGLAFPFYMSFDIRDSGFKVAPVDANIYPAGFNNICPTDREASPPLIDFYLKAHYGKPMGKIALLCEEHTSNLFYWDNVRALCEMIRNTGREVRLTVPKALASSLKIKTAAGFDIEVFPSENRDGRLFVGPAFEADLIISNNDFSDSQEAWAKGLITPINPPRELGWYQRKKSTHFKFYNQLAREFANLLGVDSWHLEVDTEFLFDCDLAFPENRQRAAEMADRMLESMRSRYQERGISDEPVLFVKNNSGTYGLAVAQVKSGDEILNWNSKARTKMKAAKGGHGVTELLFQEGIPTALRVDNHTCEPAIYMLGCDLLGGFLRAHGEKGKTESLNSPGAVYKRLCVTDLKIDVDGAALENVYGWVSRLSALAIGHETKEMGVVYTEFNVDGTCPKKSAGSGLKS